MVFPKLTRNDMLAEELWRELSDHYTHALGIPTRH